MKEFRYIYRDMPIKTVPDVMEHMLILQEELEHTTLHNLRAFNQTYYIITKNVYTKIGTGFFLHDDLMQKIDIIFAKYYFDALKQYVDHKPTYKAWKVLFDHCKSGTNYQFIYMAMGVNAHVNNDLGMALYDGLNHDRFKADFEKVNDIIRTCLKEVVLLLREDSKVINGLKNTFEEVYAYFLNFLIADWRGNAWNNYQKLRHSSGSRTSIELSALAIANTLATIDDIKEIYQLYKVII